MIKHIALMLMIAQVSNMQAMHWTDVYGKIFGGTNTNTACRLIGREPGFSFDVKKNFSDNYKTISTYPAAVACDLGSTFSRILILGCFLRATKAAYDAEEDKGFEVFKKVLINPENSKCMYGLPNSNKLLPAAVIAALAFHGLSYAVVPEKK